ncbi:hypothetical protein ACIQ6V_17070 [Streptomyces sp. NPDC096198]|uniref:hypothetical protein n=1 Tax=Streptomyces sp. NPDC096198 TaxID=3366080 RepID=UPI00381F4CDD
MTGSARGVSIFGFAENTPAASATESVVVDPGCSATLGDFSNVNPLSLAGYTNITNDTAGGSVATGFVYGAGSALYEGTVSGGTVPTQDQHLTRKDYVDAKLDPAPVALTDAPAIATDAALGSHFRVTLGGNRTLGTPAHPTDGQRAVWELVQDATGNRTLTLGPGLGSTISSVTLSTGANRRDFLTAVHNAEKNKWYVVDFVKGY